MTPSASITLDELVAMNDEIAALTRSGVPLEDGLAAIGGDMPGRLGRLARSIGERSARGESLPQVLADPAFQFPPIYRAVVEAGIRAGRLPAALESLSTSIRRLVDTRRMVVSALLYPVLLLILLVVAMAAFTSVVAPKLLDAMTSMEVPAHVLLRLQVWLGTTANYWGDLIPAVIVALAIMWWMRTRRACLAEPSGAAWLLGWLPWVGQTLRCSRLATFAEVLALLIEQQTPLAEALPLAANVTGDRRLMASARQAAEQLQAGISPLAVSQQVALPALLAWLIVSAERENRLLGALRQSAENYRRRAAYAAEMARIFVPALTIGLVAGTLAVVYTVSLFWPYSRMLWQLGMPS